MKLTWDDRGTIVESSSPEAALTAFLNREDVQKETKREAAKVAEAEKKLREERALEEFATRQFGAGPDDAHAEARVQPESEEWLSVIQKFFTTRLDVGSLPIWSLRRSKSRRPGGGILVIIG